jgi:hypothetical protein
MPPPTPPPPVPPTDAASCDLALLAVDAAVAPRGACAACAAATGAAAGCADACPACINALDAYVAACAADFDALNYEALEALQAQLNATSDCADWVSLLAEQFAGAACGAAFDHVVQYSQSAARSGVTLAAKGGGMSAPYPCALANEASCPEACQKDLDLLAAACHAEDAVRWDGNGLPGYLTLQGAPAGTRVTPLDAFKLFANGSASVPTNLANGVTVAVPLTLSACARVKDGVYPFYSPPPPSPPPPSPPPPSPLPPPSPPPPSPPPPSPPPPSPPPPSPPPPSPPPPSPPPPRPEPPSPRPPLPPLPPPKPPPPNPMSPPPPRPPPPSFTVFAVTTGVSLAGVTPDAFRATMQDAFVSATATSLSIPPASVAITGVSSAASARRRRRTALQASGGATQVDFQVFMASSSAASGISSLIATTGGPSTAALVAAGVPTTGVALTTAPSVTVMPAPPAPAPPPPSPPPPAGCGALWQCYDGVACASASTCAACPPGLAGDGRECAPCALRVVVTPSFLGGAAARAADATLSGVVSAADASCNTTGGWTFAWSSNATGGSGAPLALDAATNGAAGPSLRLPARSLASGQNAAFTLTACLASAATTCGAATLAFPVTASPLVALLGGGGGLVGETPVVLSGAASYDPDDGAAALSYAWSCAASADGGVCAAPGGAPVTLGAAATQTLTLRGAPEGLSYVVTLTVSQGGRASAANTTLTVKPGQLPLVSIAGAAALAPGAKADPGAQLVLLANATPFVPGAVTTRWAVVAQSPQPGALLNLSDAAVAATPVTSVSMVIRAGALAPGTRYTFSLTATDAAGGVGQANATVATASAPRGGSVYVTPDAGEALSTPFSLVAAGWTADADELPLSYAAEYMLGDGSAPVSLAAYQASPSIAMQLPAGLAAAGNVVTLRLSVRSAFGAVVTANASVTVTWRTFASAGEAAAFVGDATARATAALQSGDAASALQVVGGLAALLNTNTTGGASSGSGDDVAAAAQRASLLSVVAGALGQSGAGALAAPAAVESTAALVSSLLSSPAQLSPEGAATALGVLGALAGAGAAVSPAAAQSVASALSAVALAPGASSSSGSSSSSSSNFGAVLGVLDSLASSQASGLQVPGQAPATVSTPQIQMSVSLNEGGADSPLFAAQLSAPGSASSFEALPPGALDAAGGAPVASTFLSLAFDAHSAGGSSNNTGGVTRLAFASAAGAGVAVENLSTPLLFTLPASSLGAGQQASCAWWDDDAAAYRSDGCAALPSPTPPPPHELAFASGFVVGAAGAASMAMAWNISGPLLAGCSVAFLDCTNATARAAEVLQLDPASPRAAPVVACGNASGVVLRAYVGAECALRRADNAAGCAWDVLQQTFTGAGCVAANATRCMCTHLTDFTSSPQPSIPVCSAADLFGLNPADIVTKLKLLFTVVISLFGIMNVGAALGFLLDKRERRHVVERLLDARCGFRVAVDEYNGEDTGCGALVWRFGLDALPDELAAPAGPAVHLSAVFGLPFARLRAALPDEWFATRFADALGRRHGFSAAGMRDAAGMHAELLKPPPKRRAGALTRKLCTSLSRAQSMGGAHAYADVDTARLEELVGTALVLAFLQTTQLMPVVELAAHRAAADAHFRCVRTPAGQDFASVGDTCLSLLAPGVMNGRARWWPRARLFRLVLSQSADGYWDISETVAFALEARSTAELAELRRGAWERFKNGVTELLGRTAELLTEGDAADIARHGFDSGGSQDDGGGGGAAALDNPGAHALAKEAAAAAGDATDDPLLCSPAALLSSIPSRLAAVHGRGTGGGKCTEDVDAKRVWATLCCTAFLETLNVSWLWTDGCVVHAQRHIDSRAIRLSHSRPVLCFVLCPSGICTRRWSTPSWTRPASGWLTTRRRGRRWRTRWQTAARRARRSAPCGCGTARGKRA